MRADAIDNGPGRHHAVFMVSPYVSRRLITEQELVGAAMDAHGPDKAFKFIEEVFWRYTSKDGLSCDRRYGRTM